MHISNYTMIKFLMHELWLTDLKSNNILHNIYLHYLPSQRYNKYVLSAWNVITGNLFLIVTQVVFTPPKQKQ